MPGGWRAELTDYGAILTRLLVPAAAGPPVDVVLGFGYLAGHTYFGAICGRVANRIATGRFDLDGKTFSLTTNNGANHLHGGVVGFDKQLWTGTPRTSPRGPAVDFELVSPAGDEGYPGRLTARATYTLTPDGTNPGGIDHDFLVRGWQPDGALRSVAVLRDPASGRTPEILSDQPGLQVYTGNYLDGTLRGKGGAAYAKHAGICLETQLHPDSVHHPEWPSPRLEPGATYRHTMVHRFTTR